MSEDAFYTSRAWLDLRYQALNKSNGMCQCCGHRGDALNPLQVDHIRPRSKWPGLALHLNNLQVLCRHCNLGKGAKDATDWRFLPSKEISILHSMDRAKRFRLQQLGWIKINGENREIRAEAIREYRRIWRECEAEWIATKAAAE